MAKKSVKKGRSSKQVSTKGKAKAREISRANLKAAHILLIIILAALAYIVVAGPFQRGLFFSKELLPVHSISFCLFILWCTSRLLRGEGVFFKNPLDYCVFALVVFYFLSFFVAVNRSAALEEFLKVANYFVLYLLVFDLCRSRPFDLFRKKGMDDHQNGEEAGGYTVVSIILHLLLAAGVAVALGGLGTAAGTWDLHGAYVGGRIHTPLQYPNTAAAYLTAAFFIALGLSARVEKWYLRPVYLVPGIIIFITFIFTYSRGAWLLMPLLAVLFILVIGAGNRLRMAVYLALSGIVTLLLMTRLDHALRGDDPALAWRYIILAVCLMLAGGLFTELFLSLGWKLKAVAAGAAALLVLVAGVYVVLPVLGRPLHLERKPGEGPANQYLEQRVGKLSPGENYLLSLEVEAAQEAGGNGESEPDYAWRLLVLAYDADEERTTLLDHREGPTQGWEKREFELQPEEHTQRMEVRLYNRFPGTAVSARNVSLQDSRGEERPLNFTLHRLLPDRVYTRMYAIGAGESSVEGRLTFYRDALKIIKDYPLLGAGGGGWEALYFGYQERDYYTTEVHNHFLQVWIEAGTPGFLAFVAIWVFFIRAFLRSFLRDGSSPERKNYWAAIFVPAVALGAHSAIDFNLSLGAVSIFLFVLLGAGRSLDRDESYFSFALSGWRKKRKKGVVFGLPSWSTCVAGTLAGIFLLVISVSLWNGYRLGVEAEKKVRENRLQEALELFSKAVDWDPYQAANYADLGKIYDHLSAFAENKDVVPQLQEKALGLARKACELEPYNSRYALDYGTMLLRYGDVEKGLRKIEKVIELHPQNPDSFLQVARAQLAVAENYLGLEDRDRAEGHLREALRLEGLMAEAQGSAEVLNFYLGKAAYLLGDYERSLDYFTGVGEKDENYEEALVYLAVIFEKKGEDDQAEELKETFAENSELLELYRRLLP